MRSRRPRLLTRGLTLVILVSFLLPFTTVESCSGEIRDESGLQLLGRSGGELLFPVLLLAVALLVASFFRPTLSAATSGLLLALRALLCAGAALQVDVATGLAALFEKQTDRIGYFLCLAGWGGLYVLSLVRAFERGAEDRGLPAARGRWPGLLVGVALLGPLAWAILAWPPQPLRTIRDVLAVVPFLVPLALAVRFAILAWRRRAAG